MYYSSLIWCCHNLTIFGNVSNLWVRTYHLYIVIESYIIICICIHIIANLKICLSAIVPSNFQQFQTSINIFPFQSGPRSSSKHRPGLIVTFVQYIYSSLVDIKTAIFFSTEFNVLRKLIFIITFYSF